MTTFYSYGVVGRGKGCKASGQARTGGEDEPGPHSEQGCFIVIKIFREGEWNIQSPFYNLGDRISMGLCIVELVYSLINNDP